MNKRALMLTAASAALLSGQAYGALPNPPCSTSQTSYCDITTEITLPLYTGTANPSLTSSQQYSGLGNITVDTDGSIVIGTSPTIAPAITINSSNTVTNTTTISYVGISDTVGVLLEEGSVPTSTTTNGSAEYWTGEYISTTGVLNLTGAGNDKVGILIGGGAIDNTSGQNTNATTGIYGNQSLGYFTGVTPSGGGNPVAVNIESGSTLEVQGLVSYGVYLIAPTYTSTTTPGGATVNAPSGGGTLIGDIDIGGTLAMTPTTVGAVTASGNVAINIAGFLPYGTTTANPVLAGTAYAGTAYAMVGNINIASTGVVSSEGAGAEGIVIQGELQGGIFNSGQISTLGTTAPSSAVNAEDPEGGSAILLTASVTGGIYNNGRTIASSGAGSASATISTIGTAPTILISPAANPNSYELPLTLGKVTVDPDYGGQFSLLNRGNISAAAEDANLSTSTIEIAGDASDPVTLTGGIFNSGTITAGASTNTETASESVTATAITIGAYTTVNTGTDSFYAGGQTAALINTSETNGGTISATVSGPDTGVATAISIAANAHLPSIFNSGTISASATTTTLTTTGTLNAFAITDSSGTLTSIVNEGTISASVTTLDSNSGATLDTANQAVAIDVANNAATPVIITDQATAAANRPATISGNIGFGELPGTLTITGLNQTDYASVAGNIYFNNICAAGTTIAACSGLTDFNDTLTIAQYGTFTGEIKEDATGSVDITIKSNGTLNYLTAAQTNLNATTSTSVVAGTPLSVGALTIQTGGVLKESLSQGYNLLFYPGVSVINAQSVTIQDPSNNISPLQIAFGSYVGAPSTGGNAASFVLLSTPGGKLSITSGALDAMENSIQINQSNAIPFLFTGDLCTYNVATVSTVPVCHGTEPISSTNSEIVLNLAPKSASALGLTGYAAKMFPYANQALVNDNTLGAAMVNDVTNAQQAQAAYAAFAPDVSGATRATAISLTDSATNIVAARQRALRMYANQEGATTLWGQQFAERLSQNNTSTLTGYNDAGYGFVLGMDDGDPVDGRYGGAFTFFSGGMSQKEPTSAKTSSEYYLLTAYTDWRGKGLFVDTQFTAGYGNLKGRRYITLTDSSGNSVSREAMGNRPTELLAGGLATGGIFTAGGTVVIPQLSLDGLTMREESYTESGGGDGFDLHVQPYYANSLRGFVGTDVREDFNFGDFYMQPELRVGYRYDFVKGSVKLKANFASVSALNGQTYDPFTIEGPDPGHGNIVLGGGLAATTGAWSIGLSYDFLRGGSGPTEQTGLITIVGRI